jgi:hypothetical protein
VPSHIASVAQAQRLSNASPCVRGAAARESCFCRVARSHANARTTAILRETITGVSNSGTRTVSRWVIGRPTGLGIFGVSRVSNNSSRPITASLTARRRPERSAFAGGGHRASGPVKHLRDLTVATKGR